MCFPEVVNINTRRKKQDSGQHVSGGCLCIASYINIPDSPSTLRNAEFLFFCSMYFEVEQGSEFVPTHFVVNFKNHRATFVFCMYFEVEQGSKVVHIHFIL